MRTHVMKYCFVAILMFGSFGFAKQVRANPSSKSPKTALAVHGTVPEAKALAASLYNQTTAIQEQLEKIASSNNRNGVDPKRLKTICGQAWVGLQQVRQLEAMGESAAEDLRQRFYMQFQKSREFGIKSRSNPAGSKFHNTAQKTISKQAKSRTKFLDQSEAAINSGKHERVLPVIASRSVDFIGLLVTHSPKQFGDISRRWVSVFNKAQMGTIEKAMPTYQQLFSEKIAAEKKIWTDFGLELETSVNLVSNGGTLKIEGEDVSDPVEGFRNLGQKWLEASTALMRAHAIGAISRSASGTGGMDMGRPMASASGSSDGTPVAEGAPTDADLGQAAERGVATMAKLAEAILVGAPQDKKLQTFSQLLQEIVALDRRMAFDDNPLLTATWERFNSFLSQSPELQKKVNQYRAATDPVLSFRAKFVELQAAAIAGSQAPDLAESIAESEDIPEGFRPFYLQKPNLGKGTICPDSIRVQLDALTGEAGKRVVGKSFRTGPVLSMASNKEIGVVPNQGDCYGNVLLKLDFAPTEAIAKRVLFLGGSFSEGNLYPLSPQSADAVDALVRRDFQSVIGSVAAIHCQSLGARAMTLPGVAAPLIPIGSTPIWSEKAPPSKSIVWRVDIMPSQIQTRHFAIAQSSAN